MSDRTKVEFQPLAGVLAAVLPGLGHAFLGDPKRGLLVFAGVMGMFMGGLLIGGIDAVDRVEDKWWFVLQAGVGPTAFAVDAVHQNYFKVREVVNGRERVRSGLPDPAGNGGEPARNRKSLGRVNEAGALYAAMAGMLNAIAVIDALWHVRRPRGARREGAVS